MLELPTMKCLAILLLCNGALMATAFIGVFTRLGVVSTSKLQMVDVELIFPGNKKCKAASGSLMKDGNVMLFITLGISN